MIQVSRQIRSEYRPMWLKHATFVIDWHSIHAFLQLNHLRLGSESGELAHLCFDIELSYGDSEGVDMSKL